MAIAPMLRRALPLGIRSFRSPRILQSAAIHHPLSREAESRTRYQLLFFYGFTLTRQLSTAAENQCRVLREKIRKGAAALDPALEDDKGFSIDIQDINGSFKLVLCRTHVVEVLKVYVDFVSIEERSQGNIPCSVPLLITLTKSSGKQYVFGIKAFPCKFEIESLLIRDLQSPASTDDEEEQLPTDFCNLSSTTQKACYAVLRARMDITGITSILFQAEDA